MKTRVMFAVGILLLASSLVWASEGTVTGSFRAGKNVIAPRHAAAYTTRNPFDVRKSVTEVVLSEAPFDVAGAVAALDLQKFRLTDPALRNGGHVVLWIDGDGRVVMNATVSEPRTLYSGSTEERGASHRELKAELTENRPGHIAGRVYTPKPVVVAGQSYQLDVTFSTDVAARAGSKLPPGGGAPGKALEGLLAAMAKSDGAVVRTSLSRKVVGHLYDSTYRTEAANLAFAIDMLSRELPANDVKVVGGELAGDAAILEVNGSTGGVKALYLIRMLKEDGVWTFDEAFTAGYL